MKDSVNLTQNRNTEKWNKSEDRSSTNPSDFWQRPKIYAEVTGGSSPNFPRKLQNIETYHCL